MQLLLLFQGSSKIDENDRIICVGCRVTTSVVVRMTAIIVVIIIADRGLSPSASSIIVARSNHTVHVGLRHLSD